MDPLRAMQVALTRQPIGDAQAAPWIPQERVGLATMLEAYTSAGAYANRRESLVGTLEPGKKADLVVLGGDLLSASASSLHALGVKATLVEGVIVHGAL